MAFQAYLRRNLDTINAIERVYQQEENPEAWLTRLSDHLIDCVQSELDGITKKGKKSEQQINYNMILAVYVFPALLEQKNKSVCGAAGGCADDPLERDLQDFRGQGGL